MGRDRRRQMQQIVPMREDEGGIDRSADMVGHWMGPRDGSSEFRRGLQSDDQDAPADADRVERRVMSPSWTAMIRR